MVIITKYFLVITEINRMVNRMNYVVREFCEEYYKKILFKKINKSKLLQNFVKQKNWKLVH